jgi:hypothetical protein
MYLAYGGDVGKGSCFNISSILLKTFHLHKSLIVSISYTKVKLKMLNNAKGSDLNGF